MFRATRPLLAAAIKPLKATTGITGIDPVHDPLPILRDTYNTTLSVLTKLPSTSVYRQATEALTKNRLSIVDKSGGDVRVVEKDLGVAEQAIMVAKDELMLAAKMIEWKPWETLEEDASPNQWRYFDPGSNEEKPPAS